MKLDKLRESVELADPMVAHVHRRFLKRSSPHKSAPAIAIRLNLDVAKGGQMLSK